MICLPDLEAAFAVCHPDHDRREKVWITSGGWD
jgi:hypothetical protein